MSQINTDDINESFRRIQTVPDKSEWKTTTSRVFKLNVIQHLCLEPKRRVIEFGSAQGHTTYFISPITSEILAVDYDADNCKKVKELDCKNVSILQADLYADRFKEFIRQQKFDVAIIDAVHVYDNVKSDIESAISAGVREFIFDDYGAFDDVKRAVDEFISDTRANGYVVHVSYIGMPPGTFYPNTTFQTLSDWEGVTVKIHKYDVA